jgi:hypothetical protein
VFILQVCLCTEFLDQASSCGAAFLEYFLEYHHPGSIVKKTKYMNLDLMATK